MRFNCLLTSAKFASEAGQLIEEAISTTSSSGRDSMIESTGVRSAVRSKKDRIPQVPKWVKL